MDSTEAPGDVHETAETGMDRREALKAGVLAVGTAAWVTPAVQALTVSPASAAQPSGGAIKAKNREKHEDKDRKDRDREDRKDKDREDRKEP